MYKSMLRSVCFWSAVIGLVCTVGALCESQSDLWSKCGVSDLSVHWLCGQWHLAYYQDPLPVGFAVTVSLCGSASGSELSAEATEVEGTLVVRAHSHAVHLVQSSRGSPLFTNRIGSTEHVSVVVLAAQAHTFFSTWQAGLDTNGPTNTSDWAIYKRPDLHALNHTHLEQVSKALKCLRLTDRNGAIPLYAVVPV